MKEVKEAIRALRSKAETYEKLAQALEHLDKFAHEYKPTKRHLTPAGKRRIAVAQKARWAKFRKANLHVIKKAS